MARCHQERTQRHSSPSTQHSIAEQPAEHGYEVYEADVKAEDLGRERLRRQWSGHCFNGRPESFESHNVFDVAGQQQLVDHIQDEKRQHAVEGDPLPEFGASDKEQSARLPKEISTVRESRSGGDCDNAGVDCH
jgi:hypothetical protein